MLRFHFLLAGGGLLLALLSGCAKDGPTLVQGQVVDKDTGQPVPRAEVQVHAFSAGSGSGGGGYGPALGGPYLADATGRFSFSFEARKNTSYNLNAYGPLGHVSPDDGVEVKSGQKNLNLRLPVQAPAWVRIKLIDEPPLITAGRVITGGYDGNSDTYRLPLTQTESYIRGFIANHPVRVGWQIDDFTKSTTTEGHKDFNITSLDTVTVEIRF